MKILLLLLLLLLSLLLLLMRKQADKFIGVLKNVFVSIEAKKTYAFIYAWTGRKSSIYWVDT